MTAATTSEQTRARILQAAFDEFYRSGFQGGSLNRIVSEAGITKGALFHHFKGKHDLAYHVVEEIIRPTILTKWVSPMRHSQDPIPDLKRIMTTTLKEDEAMLCRGCPLNNLAQEMSPLDEEFRQRINAIYEEWRASIAQGLRNGIACGAVRSDVVPEATAAFIVASLAGMVGTAKSAQSLDLLRSAAKAMFQYMDTLKP